MDSLRVVGGTEVVVASVDVLCRVVDGEEVDVDIVRADAVTVSMIVTGATGLSDAVTVSMIVVGATRLSDAVTVSKTDTVSAATVEAPAEPPSTKTTE